MKHYVRTTAKTDDNGNKEVVFVWADWQTNYQKGASDYVINSKTNERHARVSDYADQVFSKYAYDSAAKKLVKWEKLTDSKTERKTQVDEKTKQVLLADLIENGVSNISAIVNAGKSIKTDIDAASTIAAVEAVGDNR